MYMNLRENETVKLYLGRIDSGNTEYDAIVGRLFNINMCIVSCMINFIK